MGDGFTLIPSVIGEGWGYDEEYLEVVQVGTPTRLTMTRDAITLKRLKATPEGEPTEVTYTVKGAYSNYAFDENRRELRKC